MYYYEFVLTSCVYESHVQLARYVWYITRYLCTCSFSESYVIQPIHNSIPPPEVNILQMHKINIKILEYKNFVDSIFQTNYDDLRYMISYTVKTSLEGSYVM